MAWNSFLRFVGLNARITWSLCFLFGVAFAEDFALKDNDTVVFLGDSITAAQSYGKTIENYTLLRFPSRKVRFLTRGRGVIRLRAGWPGWRKMC